MRQASLLVVNSLATYAGAFIQILCSICLIRVLLDTMGQYDYGLFTTLVAGGALVSIIQTGIAEGASRHLAIEVGAGNQKALKSVFSCTVLLMILSGLVFTLLGLLATDAVIACCNVEASRTSACRSAYFLSLGVLAAGVVTMPWQAMLRAKQQLVALSFISVMKPVLILIAALALYVLPGDRIVVFASLTTAIAVTIRLAIVLYCMQKNSEAFFRFDRLDLKHIRSIARFGSWIVYENLALGLREKGSILMLTAFFGPVTSTAYDVAQKLGNQLLVIGTTFLKVLSPAITNSVGAGKTDIALKLGNTLSCYSGYAVSALMIPFVLETEFIIELIIGTSSPAMVLFARWIAITKFIGLSSWGDGAVAKSQNRIAVISLGLSLPFAFTFGAAYLAFRFGVDQIWILPAAMFLATFVGAVWFRPWYIRKLNGLGWSNYFKTVFSKLLFISAGASLLPVLVFLNFTEGFWRLVLVTAICDLSIIFLIWRFGMTELELNQFKQMFQKARKKYQGKMNSAT